MTGPKKDAVKELYEQGITNPNAIIAELRRKQPPEPKKSQLQNYLSHKKTLEGPKIISIGQFVKICNDYMEPTSIYNPFVVAKEFGNGDNAHGETFRFFISTQMLLRTQSNLVQADADATYKLLWEGK